MELNLDIESILPSHTYNNDSEYDIKIEGNFPGMTFSYNSRIASKIIYYSDIFPDDYYVGESISRKYSL